MDLYNHRWRFHVFHYSPLAAVFFAPFAAFPTPLGNALLRTTNLLVFLPALCWWMRTALPGEWSPRQRASFFLLVALMCTDCLLDVQVNVLLIGVLLAAMAAVGRERWWLAAGLCAFAVHLKVYPAALALLVCLFYPREFLGRWLTCMLVGGLIPFVLQQPDYVARQYQDWVCYGLNRGGAGYHFQDVMRLCTLWIIPFTRTTYNLIEVVAGVMIAGICWGHRRRGLTGTTLNNTLFALAGGWMTALGPSAEPVTYILIAPVLAAAVVGAWSEPQPGWVRVLVTVAVAILILAQLELLFPLDRPLEQMAALPLAGLGLLLAVAPRGWSATDQKSLPAAAPDQHPRWAQQAA
jgi:hypothetical protein